MIGGQNSLLTVDRASATRRGVPYVPASAIKGAMRLEFERLLRAAGVGACLDTGAPRERRTCGKCPACHLFGAEGTPNGALRFHDGVLVWQGVVDGRLLRQNRTCVSISRMLGKAEDGRLFTQELVPAGLEFECRIDVLRDASADDLGCFGRALQWWKASGLTIGSGRSRGLGEFGLGWSEIGAARRALHYSPGVRRVFAVAFTQDVGAAEPLRVGATRLRNYLARSLGFVPSSAVRGAVGWGLAHAGLAADEVTALVETGAFRPSPLYPPLERAATRRSPTGPSGWLQPATAVGCKLDKEHAPFDTLVARLLLDASISGGLPEAEAELGRMLEECPRFNCQGTLKSVEPVASTHRRLLTKLRIDRQAGRAEEGRFYVYDTLAQDEEPRAFCGYLFTDTGAADLVRSLDSVLVGGARSKGFGNGRLEVSEAPDGQGTQEGVEERLDRFDRRVRSAAEMLGLPDPVGDRVLFPLLLLSDLVVPPGATVRRMMEACGWEWQTAFLHWSRAGGWSEGGNLSRPLVPVLQRGGVVVLAAPRASRAEVVAWLVQAEREGIGLQRELGMGWVQACCTFHDEYDLLKEGAQRWQTRKL